jgi:hypothetical protein
MLINFELVPVGKIVPWGPADNLSLSWFGLTDGVYWMNVGDAKLFEYSEDARQHGAPRYCDYQVVRLLEDILDILPSILEPVPSKLVEYISGDSGRSWRGTFSAWTDKNFDVMNHDEYWHLNDRAYSWIGKRYLDSLYLSPSASILLWSDEANVHIEWDNTEKSVDGKLAWTAIKGSYVMSREDFIREVESFHARLIEQMKARVEEIEAGALAPEIHIDVSGLVAEHQERTDAFKKAMENTYEACWPEVENAIAQISRTLPILGSSYGPQ